MSTVEDWIDTLHESGGTTYRGGLDFEVWGVVVTDPMQVATQDLDAPTDDEWDELVPRLDRHPEARDIHAALIELARRELRTMRAE